MVFCRIVHNTVHRGNEKHVNLLKPGCEHTCFCLVVHIYLLYSDLFELIASASFFSVPSASQQMLVRQGKSRAYGSLKAVTRVSRKTM